MILNYSLGYLHVFVILRTIWCFSESCIDDNSCLAYGLQCRLKHCLCPSDKFWAGSTKNCISCPLGWINLYIFCIHHETELTHWLDAMSKCKEMIPTSRLLEIHNLNEYDFIQKSIKEILIDKQMKIEISNSAGLLSSVVAFIGSQGTGSLTEEWIYRFGNQSTNTYRSTSPMWCKEKYWGPTIIPAEPSWEKDDKFNLTVQALKRLNDSNDACLISLPEMSKQSFLCEIAGDSERFDDPTILSFLFTAHTREQNITTDDMSFVTSEQLLTSDILNITSTLNLDMTSNESVVKDKQWLFTIIIIVSVFMILIISIIIIAVKFKKKDSSKSNKRKSSSRSNTDKKTIEDLQSNNSFETPFSSESAASQSMQSGRLSASKQYSPSNSSRSINADKVALWDVMESSIASSTSREPTKPLSPSNTIQR